MVYFLSQKDNYMYDYGVDPLDGDLKKVRPVDITPDDGLRIMPSATNQG